jgi:hypothetical protein
MKIIRISLKKVLDEMGYKDAISNLKNAVYVHKDKILTVYIEDGKTTKLSEAHSEKGLLGNSVEKLSA